jgi:hypothetical protein
MIDLSPAGGMSVRLPVPDAASVASALRRSQLVVSVHLGRNWAPSTSLQTNWVKLDNQSSEPIVGGKSLGTALIDLYPLEAMQERRSHSSRELEGWYHVADTLQQIQGQLKVNLCVTCSGEVVDSKSRDSFPAVSEHDSVPTPRGQDALVSSDDREEIVSDADGLQSLIADLENLNSRLVRNGFSFFAESNEQPSTSEVVIALSSDDLPADESRVGSSHSAADSSELINNSYNAIEFDRHTETSSPASYVSDFEPFRPSDVDDEDKDGSRRYEADVSWEPTFVRDEDNSCDSEADSKEDIYPRHNSDAFFRKDYAKADKLDVTSSDESWKEKEWRGAADKYHDRPYEFYHSADSASEADSKSFNLQSQTREDESSTDDFPNSSRNEITQSRINDSYDSVFLTELLSADAEDVASQVAEDTSSQLPDPSHCNSSVPASAISATQTLDDEHDGELEVSGGPNVLSSEGLFDRVEEPLSPSHAELEPDDDAALNIEVFVDDTMFVEEMESALNDRLAELVLSEDRDITHRSNYAGVNCNTEEKQLETKELLPDDEVTEVAAEPEESVKFVTDNRFENEKTVEEICPLSSDLDFAKESRVMREELKLTPELSDSEKIRQLIDEELAHSVFVRLPAAVNKTELPTRNVTPIPANEVGINVKSPHAGKEESSPYRDAARIVQTMMAKYSTQQSRAVSRYTKSIAIDGEELPVFPGRRRQFVEMETARISQIMLGNLLPKQSTNISGGQRPK